MGPGIVIPLIILAIFVPVTLMTAKKFLKDPKKDLADEPVNVPNALLTSSALRNLPTPTWRVVYEIADEKLGGPNHVLVGPPGIFALRTTLDPMPGSPNPSPEAREIAAAAIARGGLDDALRRCGLSARGLVTVHWGVRHQGAPISVDVVPGETAVDGRSLQIWAENVLTVPASGPLSQDQVDLAWRTITTAIGRPDPLR